jgi:SAM-dependent methyltransferase
MLAPEQLNTRASGRRLLPGRDEHRGGVDSGSPPSTVSSVAQLTPRELEELSRRTIAHYQRHAASFWEGTRDHDVSENIEALLCALGGEPGRHILDFGCGPGRDLLELRQRGHQPVGLDGCEAFVEMARARAAVPVHHQQFLALELPREQFDGVFANASLFHVPTQELPRVLSELWSCLVSGGVLFCSNPRGDNREGYSGERYGAYHDEARWLRLVTGAGFELIAQYHRPKGLPREKQPWLCTLWRKGDPSAPRSTPLGG